jgi:hypothetical protein
VTYLTQWVDPALEINPDDTTQKIENDEVERLLRMNAVAVAAGKIPRRIGGEATSEELASDKKRCKRIAYITLKLAAAWADKPPEKLRYKQDVTKFAAVIDWKNWWAEHQIWLNNRRRYVATMATKQEKELWGKSSIVKLTNEEAWLLYALRD